MTDAITAPKLYTLKSQGKKIVCLTAYDFTSANLADLAGVDVVLVGDSAANVVFGESTTLPLSIDVMVALTRAVARGTRRAMVVADMPFGSYGTSVEKTVTNGVALMQAGAQAVKIEGALEEEIWALGRIGIPVMGHVGMTPQSVHAFGGFKVQGKGEEGQYVLDQAKRIQDAGAFAVVLELVPSSLAKEITHELNIPTIGIGAGSECDGQIQVWHDVLGLQDVEFRHAKRFASLRQAIQEALQKYALEVREGQFPTSENSH